MYLIATGCVKEVTLNIRNPKPTLVVEGLLLTDSTPCKVTLSYSGAFNKNGGQLQDFINGATVYLKEIESEDSVQLVNIDNGAYVEAPNSKIFAKPGNSYSLSIQLLDGSVYASIPEKIVPVPKDFMIDSIGVGVPYKLDDLYGADISIETTDPADQTNYYRWITAQDYIPRKATGFPCNSSENCEMYCYQSYTDRTINILSDALINGKQIKYQPTIVSPYYWYGRHYVELKQLSLTKEAYQFWKLFQEQTTRTGSILDPLPSPVNGNIYNVNDPNELALGFFEASDVATLKFVIAPQFMNSYYTLAYAFRYVDPQQRACYEAYPNAMKYPPADWEDAPEYLIQVY